MLSDLIFRVVQWCYELPSIVPLLMLMVVLGLPTTVIHELGHGIAANVIAKVPVRIEISMFGIDWVGVCRLDPEARVTVRSYLAIVAAGPLATLLQAVGATWLTAMVQPGTLIHAVLAALALSGWIAAVINLVPMVLDGVRTDGRRLLDLTLWLLGGRAPEWVAVPDPREATSVAPPA